MVTHPTKFDPADQYRSVEFVDEERHAHSYDLNDMQRMQEKRVTDVANVLLRDGDVTQGGRIFVNPDTGFTQLEAGKVYAGGIVFDVPATTFTLPINVTLWIGLCVHTDIISYIEDPDLRGNIAGTRAYGEPGMDRKKVWAVWQRSDVSCDGQFYPIYQVVNGVVTPRVEPPIISPINDALARYDREANGHYIVNGWEVTGLGYRSGDQHQVFSIARGTINVWGYKLDLPSDYRFSVLEEPDLYEVEAEPHAAPGVVSGPVVVTLNHGPVVEVESVTLLKEKTVTVTHGAFSGAIDALPDTSVASIVEVVQGVTTYTATTDYVLTADQVDWTPAGAEPAPGSSYDVTYRYYDTTDADSFTATTVTVSDPVPSSTIIVNYFWALPRIDVITVDRKGIISYLKGVSALYSPVAPRVPNDVLAIAEVVNRWRSTPDVKNTKTRSIHMNKLVYHGDLLYDLYDLLAQERLRRNVDQNQVAARRGLFVDPFLDDDMRDQGIEQTGAIVGEMLRLPILGGPEDKILGPNPYILPYTQEVVIAQELSSACMLINPYAVFQPLPGVLTLSPAIDFWTFYEDLWASDVTEVFVVGEADTATSTTTLSIRTLPGGIRQDARLRSRTVDFTIKGFGAGEILEKLTFDGIDITPA